MGDLDFAPPVDQIPEGDFGGYAKGVQPVECLGARLQDNGQNAWVEFKITGGEYANQGRFSMNLYLPTKENLNQKAREKGDKDKALAAFFHYGQTCKDMGIPQGKTIAEAFELMKGWRGDALFENREGYNTNIKKVIGKATAPELVAAGAAESDTPF